MMVRRQFYMTNLVVVGAEPSATLTRVGVSLFSYSHEPLHKHCNLSAFYIVLNIPQPLPCDY